MLFANLGTDSADNQTHTHTAVWSALGEPTLAGGLD